MRETPQMGVFQQPAKALSYISTPQGRVNLPLRTDPTGEEDSYGDHDVTVYGITLKH